MTVAQKQAFLNELMSMLNQLDPVSSDCLAEKAYYAAHLDKAVVQYAMTKQARLYSETYFCSPGLDNDNKNAYRHMMWNALMAKAWGYDDAKFLSNLHECDGGSHPLNHNMDLWNNEIGADYGANYDYSNNSLGLEISIVVKNGLGRRIENNYLIPTNDEGACTNN